MGSVGRLPPSSKRAALGIYPTPIVELGEEKVTVDIVTFSKGGGFYQEEYEVNRSFPHTPREVTKLRLVKYSHGIIY